MEAFAYSTWVETNENPQNPPSFSLPSFPAVHLPQWKVSEDWSKLFSASVLVSVVSGFAGFSLMNNRLSQSVTQPSLNITQTPPPAKVFASQPTNEKGRVCRQVSTQGSTLNVRQTPSRSSPVLKKLSNGQKIAIKGDQKGEWVALANGGYVSSNYLKSCP